MIETNAKRLTKLHNDFMKSALVPKANPKAPTDELVKCIRAYDIEGEAYLLCNAPMIMPANEAEYRAVSEYANLRTLIDVCRRFGIRPMFSSAIKHRSLTHELAVPQTVQHQQLWKEAYIWNPHAYIFGCTADGINRMHRLAKEGNYTESLLTMTVMTMTLSYGDSATLNRFSGALGGMSVSGNQVYGARRILAQRAFEGSDLTLGELMGIIARNTGDWESMEAQLLNANVRLGEADESVAPASDQRETSESMTDAIVMDVIERIRRRYNVR